MGDKSKKLTKVELEVLMLLQDGIISPKQISIRRKVSRQSTYQILRKLKKKGIINHKYKLLEKIKSTLPKRFTHHKKYIRLHGQEFNIQILYKDHRYLKQLEKTNFPELDGNTLKLYRNSIEVYSGKSFYADDCQKATSKSFHYWNHFFSKLESEYNIIIRKQRYHNIKLVNNHYAEIDNEIAKDLHLRADKIRIYTNDDGKLWFLIDNSFNLHEAECVHPETAKHDMERVKGHFNDLRDMESYKASDVKAILDKISANLNAFNETLGLLANSQLNTQNQLNAFLRVFTGTDNQESNKDDKGQQKIPYYFG